MAGKRRMLVVLVVFVLLQLLFQTYVSKFTSFVRTYIGKFPEKDGFTTSFAMMPFDTTSNTKPSNSPPWLLEAYLKERSVRVTEVNCRKVLDGDREELSKASVLEQLKPVSLPSDTFIQALASNCSVFIQLYGFLMDPLTRLEKDFPIAYSILSYKQATQVVDLLRAIYRPQNLYCMHVDSKSTPEFRQAMEAVSACFPNVFMSSRSVNVVWGTYWVLEPELVCMADLWGKKRWKYFINLTGQEFPLRTNHELVRILTAYNGANDVAAYVPSPSTIAQRWKKVLPAPHNITVYKGQVHIVASRGFVDFILHSPVARDYRQWCMRTLHASEHFFNSLNHNSHLFVPGGGSGKVISDQTDTPYLSRSLARYKNWVPKLPCPGHKVVRGICILNVLDLPLMSTRKELFANKFYADYSRLALKCLAEELHNRTIEQSLGRGGFDVSFYQQQEFVKNRLVF